MMHKKHLSCIALLGILSLMPESLKAAIDNDKIQKTIEQQHQTGINVINDSETLGMEKTAEKVAAGAYTQGTNFDVTLLHHDGTIAATTLGVPNTEINGIDIVTDDGTRAGYMVANLKPGAFNTLFYRSRIGKEAVPARVAMRAGARAKVLVKSLAPNVSTPTKTKEEVAQLQK